MSWWFWIFGGAVEGQGMDAVDKPTCAYFLISYHAHTHKHTREYISSRRMLGWGGWLDTIWQVINKAKIWLYALGND